MGEMFFFSSLNILNAISYILLRQMKSLQLFSIRSITVLFLYRGIDHQRYVECPYGQHPMQL